MCDGRGYMGAALTEVSCRPTRPYMLDAASDGTDLIHHNKPEFHTGQRQIRDNRWIIKDHVPELKFHLCPPKWRPLWVKLINRKDLPKITDHTRICSNHFVLGKPIGIQPHQSLYMRGYSDKDSHSDNIEIQRIISSWSPDNDESTSDYKAW
ncbi:uncharacterized protein LOC144464408 [Epinephelus lanceolatus]